MTLGRIASALGLCYLLLCTGMFFFQRRLQYFPTTTSPALLKGERYRGLEEVELTAADGTNLLGWYWSGDAEVTAILFHGNAGDRSGRLGWMRDVRALGMNALVVDYRGFGGSAGQPTEDGLYLDGDATVDWARKHGGKTLVYFGRSLGGGVAVEMAVRHPPEALVLVSTFSSAVAVGAEQYPWLPVGLLMRDRYDSIAKIGSLSCPLLMLHGEADRLIPPSSGRALFEAARGPKQWHLAPGAGHNDVRATLGKQWGKLVAGFLAQHEVVAAQGDTSRTGERP